jgi:DHA1 family tetracycline resistance protein-like MFS transporter
MGFSKTGLLVWLGIPFLNLMGIAWPSAQSIMSRHTPANEQGLLQGAVNSLRGISGLIGPLMFTWVFANSIDAKPIFPAAGSTFYLAAALILLGLVIASVALAHDDPVKAEAASAS